MSSPALRVVEKENDVDKNKALEAAVSQIERAFGKGSIMRLGQDDVITSRVSSRPVRSGLDIALGIGGPAARAYRRNLRSGKLGQDDLALHVSPKRRRLAALCAFVDAEHALDPMYARKLGVQAGRSADLSARRWRTGAWKSPIRWCAPAHRCVW